ncbi:MULTISPECIES: large conductance mechanosensitive channel protein MscL [Flavobacteriaceae]|uniref:large conductance mechanosensitive channel protein MscL n=1 Tax=Flavobacteriaceae TaxID=49546 RepID=UPI000C302C98|nr:MULTISPECIES: large conductance mechanosensitive channel protein MscL [Flavobacteriaceae]AUC74600.1 large conductance mechanosensitive channel protein MscL [Olleya sp. Bg11-27]QCE41283.1 large conductance mechanosensitive channel protein MscL [Psychroserpens sp. NJDZ02]QXP60520.1 large conductance mechanosensitive channel protein MscL [Olleya sp. HaHaR_3_96]
MLKEFKNFIMTGNVIDFAVAVIMAGALGAVINGFVSKIAMPLIGLVTGGASFSDQFWTPGDQVFATVAAAKEAGVAAVEYGAWIDTIISLLVVGFVMFLIVKAYNKTKKPVEAAAPAGPSDNQLLMEIRDALKK